MTSIVLRLASERTADWMIDCAEGTQQQMLRSPLHLSKIEKLFVTHLHGDHIYGIPGLVGSRAMQHARQPLTVYGPPGIRGYIEHTLPTREAPLAYELIVKEVAPGLVFKDLKWTVTAERLDHGIESFGYRFQEVDRPGHIDERKLQALDIPKGPHLQELKQGHATTLSDGRVIACEQVVGPPIPGRAVVICGDTRPTPRTIGLARGADLLIHEATFAPAEADQATRKFHSTATEAAQVARSACVGALILTHVSPRYTEEDLQGMLAQARSVFAPTYLAHDHWSFDVP